MKSAPFRYIRANAISDVFEAYAQCDGEARIIAGGQSLMPLLNMRLAAPKALIDINGIDALSGVTHSNGSIRIGALTRFSELISSPEIEKHLPLLKLAAPHVAHPAIRNRGTIGGSLCHADPAAEVPACILALNGNMNISGPAGDRVVEAKDFFRGIFETALSSEEIVTSIDLPAIKHGESVAFEEVVRRHGDYATVGLVATGQMRSGSVSALNLVFFSVSDRPVVASRIALHLDAQPIDSLSWDTDLDAALNEDLSNITADVHTSIEAKKHLAKEILIRVLKKLVMGSKI